MKTQSKTTRHWHVRKTKSGMTSVRQHPMGYWANKDFGGKYFGFKRAGKRYDLELGNMSDAGWYWRGKKDSLAGFLLRIAHSKTTDDFLTSAKDNNLEYKSIKADVLAAVKRGDAVYEASGDNVRWHFGETFEPDPSEIEDYAERFGVDKTELEDKVWDYYPRLDYDAFKKTQQYKDIKARTVKAFEEAETFDGLMKSLNSDSVSQANAEDMLYYDTAQLNKAVIQAVKKIKGGK